MRYTVNDTREHPPLDQSPTLDYSAQEKWPFRQEQGWKDLVDSCPKTCRSVLESFLVRRLVSFVVYGMNVIVRST